MAILDVLLATYNGARFLPEQLASLDAQSFTDWRLLLRDDGSVDDSVEVTRRWAARTGRELVVIEDGRKGLGASGNFAALMAASDAPYFACCDQDDVWLPHKLELMLHRLRQTEERLPDGTPVLAYSDLKVVDDGLQEIASSFRAYAALSLPDTDRPLRDLMTQNVVTGCASLGNAALRRAALPIPAEAAMHDWWLALVAGARGQLVDVPEPTVLYRQHGANTLGATRLSIFTMVAHVAADPAASLKRARASIARSQQQAGAFCDRFEGALAPQTARLFRDYATLDLQPFLTRKRFSFRNLRWSASSFWNLVMHAII